MGVPRTSVAKQSDSSLCPDMWQPSTLDCRLPSELIFTSKLQTHVWLGSHTYVLKRGSLAQLMKEAAGKGHLMTFSLQPPPIPPIPGANTNVWCREAPACANPSDASWLEAPLASQQLTK